ncbi:MAG: hypothetical protein IPM92_11560 [Saprospiraceae bacterium]|nr:hypothetical protein [Saprospiraceae bacterium]
MKRTNFYFFESVSCSAKTLITGVFMLVLLSVANHVSAQSVPTPESVLPPLKSKIECSEIAQNAVDLLLEELKQDPNNMDKRILFDAYQHVLTNVVEPFFDMPLIMAQVYPILHKNSNDGTATGAYGFYAKSWNRDYTEMVNKFKK